MTNDLINGLFELGGAAAVATSVLQLSKDKHYAGMSPWNIIFFQAWGLWNLYFYPQLNQPFSFIGGAALAAANAAYLSLLWRYRPKAA